MTGVKSAFSRRISVPPLAVWTERRMLREINQMCVFVRLCLQLSFGSNTPGRPENSSSRAASTPFSHQQHPRPVSHGDPLLLPCRLPLLAHFIVLACTRMIAGKCENTREP